MTSQPRVAVVGAGISGLTAAYLLRRGHAVTLYEADERLGGHAHTHTIDGGTTGGTPVDSGFIVHNHRTYPLLRRLLDELGVATRATEMSMSISCAGCGLSYTGGRGLRGILAQPRRAADPRFLRMLAEVPRFHRRARALLATPAGPADSAVPTGPADATGPTWGEFLAAGGFSRYFVEHFAVPLVSCVWSAGVADTLDYPARHLFGFLDHHGMLTVTGAPTWRTVVGGSASYVRRIAERLPDVRTGTPITAITREADGVTLRTGTGAVQRYDRVVVAVHADQALDMLADATPAEKRDLAAIRYSRNQVLLHRDGTQLPAERRAWASWNYQMPSCGHHSASPQVSYWMNRLHGLTASEPVVVTLNPRRPVSRVIARMRYDHPIFTPEAVAAARRLREAGGERLAFAGAHLGWGFHEDGCRSGVVAAARFGASW